MMEVEVEGRNPQSQLLFDALQTLASPQQELTPLPTIRTQLLNALRTLPERSRLQTQWKGIFPRFYMSCCTSEILSVFLDGMRAGDELVLELMKEITRTVPAVAMSSGVQLRFFALLHIVVNAVANGGGEEGEEMVLKEESRVIVLVRLGNPLSN